MWNQIPGRELAKQLLIRIFTSGIIRTIVNVVMPIFISLYSVSYNKNVNFSWYCPLIVLLLIIVTYNIIAEILLSKKKNSNIYNDLLVDCYNNQSDINKNSATKLYRLNNLIIKHISKQKPVDKIVFEKIADFSSVSFDICNSIYKIITNRFGVETECEVTVYHSDGKAVSMIAFANKNTSPPTTYKKIYKINAKNKDYLFVRLLDNTNDKPHCCVNKEEVDKDFKYIEDSEERERKICQYIGVPLKTARKKNELLLQIDVSKPNVFGKKKKDITKIAENIFRPYVALLHKAYERDLIFDNYYDLIVEHLSLKESRD